MVSILRTLPLLALLCAGLFSSSNAITYNYTTFFASNSACSLAVDLSGYIYIGLCGAQTIVKLDGAYNIQTSFNANVKSTLVPYNSNGQGILELYNLGVSSVGTLWFIDRYNYRVLGVDSATGTSVSQINLQSVGGVLAIGVNVYSANVWVATPGASTGTATISQYDPTGALIQTISSVNDPTNLPSTYFVMGVQMDPTASYVYVGGCNTPNGGITYIPGSTFEYATAANSFGPCDVRQISLATKTVAQTLTPSAATRSYLRTNTSFFRTISIRASSTLDGTYTAGTVYADDTYAGRIYAFNNITGQQLANISGVSSSPAFTPANNIVALGNAGFNVIQNNQGAATSSVYSISNITFGNPGFVAVAPGGSPIYVTSFNGGGVAQMDTNGNIQSYIGTGTLLYPYAMAVDSSNNLYVIDAQTNVGYKYSSSGQLLFNFSDPSGNSGTGQGICVDPNNGNIYMPADNLTSSTSGAGYVLQFNSAGTLTNIIGQQISYPWTCAVLKNGNVIVDSANEPGQIYTLNPSTGAATVFGDTDLGADFECLGMAVSSDQRIFVAALNLGIYVFSASGQYIDVISSPQEDIYTYGLAYTDANGGQLYAADQFGQRVVKFTVGTTGRGGTSSSSSRTASSLATTAVFTVAALIFALFISA